MMLPSIILISILNFVLILTINISSFPPKSIVIEVKGDCTTTGARVAYEYGYRYVRQVCFFLSLIIKLN